VWRERNSALAFNPCAALGTFLVICSIISLTILASKWYVIWQNCDFLDKCNQFDPIL